MFWNLTTATLFLLAAGLLFWLGPKIAAAFKRFDEENRARIEGQIRDRRDHTAHIRHTLEVAEEQVEEIVEVNEADSRTGTPVKRYAFEGIWYATRDEAEKIRAERIGDIARGFYRELPYALIARRSDDKAKN
jgi:hypothetical protein